MTATVPGTTLVTADELLRLPEHGNRYELVRGVLVRMDPSSIRSNRIGVKVLIRLSAFVDRHELGTYGGFEAGFQLASDPDTVRAPDVWFIRAERIPAEGLPDGFWPGAPDLVVEVLSPTDRSGEIAGRLRDYMDAGVPLVWLIDPKTRAAAVFRPDQTPTFVFAEGALDGEDVLPGFRLPFAELVA